MHRFWNRHKITIHVGVGHCHRATCGNLALENGDDTAATAQHVAKAHRHIGIATAPSSRLHDQFAETLGRTHHAAGVDCLVARNHHQPFHTVAFSGMNNILRAVDIVNDCFFDVLLHKWHMFVCRGMEDNLWAEAFECSVDAALIAHIDDQ